MASSMDQLRRQAYTPVAVTQPGMNVPAGMGGSVSASLNVGGGTGDAGGLVVLAGGVVLLVLFYLWTHSIQGGP